MASLAELPHPPLPLLSLFFSLYLLPLLYDFCSANSAPTSTYTQPSQIEIELAFPKFHYTYYVKVGYEKPLSLPIRLSLVKMHLLCLDFPKLRRLGFRCKGNLLTIPIRMDQGMCKCVRNSTDTSRRTNRKKFILCPLLLGTLKAKVLVMLREKEYWLREVPSRSIPLDQREGNPQLLTKMPSLGETPA